VRIRVLYGGAGRRLVLCWPGTGLPAEEFWDLADAVGARGFKALLIEPPGHGRSDPWPGPWRFADAARLMRALLEEEGRPPVLLVGHSLGGTLMLMAHQSLQNVRGLVMLEGGLPLPAPYPSAAAARKALDEWMAASTYPDWDAWMAGARAELGHWDPRVEAGVRAMMREGVSGVEPAIDRPTIAAMLTCLSRYRPENAPVSDLPILLVHGRATPPTAEMAALRARAPRLSVAAVPNAGHELPWDAPKAVADRVLTFSETLDWTEGGPHDAGSP